MTHGGGHRFLLTTVDSGEHDGLATPVCGRPTLLVALLAVAFHGPVFPALAPAPVEGPKEKPAPASSTADVVPQDNQGIGWFLPRIRFGGVVSYSTARTSADGQISTQSGLTTTLNAGTSTYIWQPWFATLNANLGFTHSSNNSSSIEASSDAKNVIVTGGGQLNVLQLSRFPFEAHFQLNDSRATTDQLVGTTFASERFGFTQRYYRTDGDVLFGWDRNIQHSVENGRDQQDTLQLRITTKINEHSLLFTGDRSNSVHDLTGETAAVTSLALQHGYIPNPAVSIQNFVNVSQSDYRLVSGRNDSRLMQLSSNVFWRPDSRPMTVNGGVRVFALETDSTGFVVVGNPSSNKTHNANANLGVSYEFNRFTRLNANLNVNQGESNGVKSNSSSQTAGVSYVPDALELGSFRYNWSTSASASNQTSAADSQRQLTLQFSHSLSRSFRLDGGSTIGMDVSQGVSVIAGQKTTSLDPPATKQISHSGSLSWDFSQAMGAPVLRLSASDSRSLDGRKDFYQLINFQASSNLQTGPNSSWNGNFTIQSTRQGKDPLPVSAAASAATSNEVPNQDFVTNSSGSLTYQNQRMFGVRRLRFTSDLRVNGQSLLPIFGSSKSQELAAWENRLEYAIGRTQLRLNFTISSNGTPQITIGSPTEAERVRKVNRSIMFTVSRSFGDF
jgi:hypothetical protein